MQIRAGTAPECNLSHPGMDNNLTDLGSRKVQRSIFIKFKSQVEESAKAAEAATVQVIEAAAEKKIAEDAAIEAVLDHKAGATVTEIPIQVQATS